MWWLVYVVKNSIADTFHHWQEKQKIHIVLGSGICNGHHVKRISKNTYNLVVHSKLSWKITPKIKPIIVKAFFPAFTVVRFILSVIFPSFHEFFNCEISFLNQWWEISARMYLLNLVFVYKNGVIFFREFYYLWMFFNQKYEIHCL